MGIFDDCGSSSDARLDRRHGLAACCLGGDDDIDDPGIERANATASLPWTMNVTEPQGSGYTVENGVVRLAPVDVQATAPPNPSAFDAGRAAEYGVDTAYGAGLPVFTAPAQGDGGTVALLAIGGLAAGLALLSGNKKPRRR